MTNSSKKTTAASKQAVKTRKSAKSETIEKPKKSPAKAPIKAASKEAAPIKATPKAPAKATVKATPAKPTAKPTPAKPTAAAAAPAKNVPAKRAPAKPKANKKTTISVDSDIGFGNQLFLRGEGPSLSWDIGTPMSCKDSSRWEWAVEGAEKPIVFKLLINDQLWSEGENYEILPGEEKVLRPMF